jgi:hypothetical protein
MRMNFGGMALSRLINLWEVPGSLQSLRACGVVLCVALGKLVAWNLWTGETRERRRTLLLLCSACLRNMYVLLLLRNAVVVGLKKCEAGWMSILNGRDKMWGKEDVSRDGIKR